MLTTVWTLQSVSASCDVQQKDPASSFESQEQKWVESLFNRFEELCRSRRTRLVTLVLTYTFRR